MKIQKWSLSGPWKEKRPLFGVGVSIYKKMAGTTRLELATFGVTGRRSNQTELRPRVYLCLAIGFPIWAEQGSNLRPPACKADALPAELSARSVQVNGQPLPEQKRTGI